MQQSSAVKKEESSVEEKAKFSRLMLRYFVQQYGVDNLVFVMPIKRYYEFGELLKLEQDTHQDTMFRIRESRYALSENYKIELVTKYEMPSGNVLEHQETFYISDLVSMVNEGKIDVYTENPEGGMTAIYVTLKNVVSNIETNKVKSLIERVERFLFKLFSRKTAF